MKRTLIGWMVLFAVMIPAKSFALTNLIVNITPGFFLHSADAKDFRASDGWRMDEVSGYSSNAISISAGLGVDMLFLFLDTTVGVGYMWSPSITSTVFMGDVACRFKILGSEMTLGPHLTLLYFKPEWDGNIKATLSDESGVLGGLSFTVGIKTFSVLASLDYLNLTLKPDSPGISFSRNELDMSGVVFQIGVLMRF